MYLKRVLLSRSHMSICIDNGLRIFEFFVCCTLNATSSLAHCSHQLTRLKEVTSALVDTSKQTVWMFVIIVQFLRFLVSNSHSWKVL